MIKKNFFGLINSTNMKFMSKNKLILIEPEMIEPKGHFLNNLIDITKFFKHKFEIYWILNEKFKNEGTYIPQNHKQINVILSNNYIKKKNKLRYLLKEMYIFIINIFYIFFFLFYFIKNKKLFSYLCALRSNYFTIPKYFKSFYFTYLSLNLTVNDHIFFPTGRRKDIALINFLSILDHDHPKFHIRIFLPQKNKFKSFFYYLRNIDYKLKKNRIFVYVWKNNFKLFLKNSLSKKGIYQTNLMFSYDPKSKFSRLLKKTNHTIGYLGHARRERGFHLLPEIIKSLEQKKYSFKYLIQFSKISNDLIDTKTELYKLSRKNKRIKLINKYINNKEFIQCLKKVDIMPILHSANEINNITSGSAYSCVPYEIPFILPYGTNFIKNINKFKSFEKARNTDEIVEKIIKISKNFKFYIKNAKLNSKNLKKIIYIDPLIKYLD